MFCDADDYFESNAIERISDLLTRHPVDAIIFGYNLVREDNIKSVRKSQLKEGKYSKSKYAGFHLDGIMKLYWSALWNKCYRRELCYEEDKIIFHEIMEDVIFNCEYLSRCKNIYVTYDILYNYVQIGESITRKKRKDSKEDILKAKEAQDYIIKVVKTGYQLEKRRIVQYIYRAKMSCVNRAKTIGEMELYNQLLDDKELKNTYKELNILILSIQLREKIGKIKRYIRQLLRER